MNFANADTLRAIMEIRRPEARSVGSFLSVLIQQIQNKNKKTKTREKREGVLSWKQSGWKKTCPVAG